jgi:SAM-dependent methyltransferase
MTVLEPGPGMGFFTLELACRVGPHGRVIAVELQPKMLAVLLRRAKKAGLAERIEARQPKGDRLGIDDCQGKVDFALAFAMVHEVPQPRALLGEVFASLRLGARLLLAEPVGHVKSQEFEATVALAQEVGFALESRPAIRRSHAAVLVKQGAGRSFPNPG